MKNYAPGNNINKYNPLTIASNKIETPSMRHDIFNKYKNLKTRTLEQQESIQAAIENEKCKLGQELHDGVNPLLAAALLYLKLIKPASKRGVKVKETIQIILLEAIGCIRNLASDMVVAEQKQYNLKELLESYTERLKSIIDFSLTIDIENTEIISRLTQYEKTTLYRIIQEQLNNIIKYSKARTVKILFKELPTGLYLRIQDDGIGFNTNIMSNGIGLLNMKKRIEELQGTINIESSPGNGCSINIALPLYEE